MAQSSKQGGPISGHMPHSRSGPYTQATCSHCGCGSRRHQLGQTWWMRHAQVRAAQVLLVDAAACWSPLRRRRTGGSCHGDTCKQQTLSWLRACQPGKWQAAAWCASEVESSQMTVELYTREKCLRPPSPTVWQLASSLPHTHIQVHYIVAASVTKGP